MESLLTTSDSWALAIVRVVLGIIIFASWDIQIFACKIYWP